MDIGGTKTAVGAVDESCRICAEEVLPTDAAVGFEPFLQRLSDCIRRLVSAANWNWAEVCGIGIGCAGPLNPARGTIHNPYTLPGWDDVNVVAPVNEAFSVPVYLENDADAAVVGEGLSNSGAGSGANPIVMLTLGTGVGGGCLVDGTIYRGCRGEHPELGHLAVDPDGPACYCGSRGCLESLASGTAITEAGRHAGFRDSRDVFENAARRPPNAEAVRIIGRAADAVASAAWTLWHTLLPERIILGGGIAEDHFEVFERAVTDRISRATQMPRRDVSVVQARLGNRAGVIGASYLPRR